MLALLPPHGTGVAAAAARTAVPRDGSSSTTLGGLAVLLPQGMDLISGTGGVWITFTHSPVFFFFSFFFLLFSYVNIYIFTSTL